MLGRPVTASDYEGVHTTDSLTLAATYAIGAADAAQREGHADAYPVVLVLDVSGLTPLPDIDALVEAAFLLRNRGIRSQYEGMTLDEANDSEEYDGGFREGDNVIGAVVGQEQHGRIPTAFGSLPADDEGDVAFERWVETGEYPESAAIALVNQKRYLVDIGFDRLVRVLAVKRWWPEVLGFADDDEVQEEAERLEAQGYAVVTAGEFQIDATTRSVFEGPDRRGAIVDYHGTSSWHALAAFPELHLPRDPFPIVEENPRARRANARSGHGVSFMSPDHYYVQFYRYDARHPASSEADWFRPDTRLKNGGWKGLLVRSDLTSKTTTVPKSNFHLWEIALKGYMPDDVLSKIRDNRTAGRPHTPNPTRPPAKVPKGHHYRVLFSDGSVSPPFKKRRLAEQHRDEIISRASPYLPKESAVVQEFMYGEGDYYREVPGSKRTGGGQRTRNPSSSRHRELAGRLARGE